MATLAILENRVREKLGIISTDVPPTDTEIDNWIIEGQYEVAHLVNPNALPNMTVTDSLDPGNNAFFAFTDLSAVGVIGDIPIDILYVRYKKSGGSVVYAIRITPEIMAIIDDASNSLFDSTKNNFYCFRGGRVELNPAAVIGAGNLIVTYIKSPQKTRTTECDLPDFLEPFVIDYATAEAYKQRKDFQNALVIKQAYFQKLNAVNQRYSNLHKLGR